MSAARTGTAPKRQRWRIVVGICLCIPLVFALALLGKTIAPYFVGASSAESVVEDFVTLPAEETDTASGEEADPWPIIDWAGLAAANPDAVGWVYAPGTRINYGIVQASAAAPQHYLRHDFNNASSYYGCPYVAADCAAFGGINSNFPVIYGHHLINGTMFSDFAKYSDQAYAEAHRTLYVLTPTENRTLRVIAANVVNADYETIEAGFETTADLASYIKQKLSESEVVLETPVSPSRVYAFVCCSYQGNNYRTIVYAIDEATERTGADTDIKEF